MKLHHVDAHARQIVKQRTVLRAGRMPWQLIKRPKGMETREFERRIRLLRHHEREYKRKSAEYLLQFMK